MNGNAGRASIPVAAILALRPSQWTKNLLVLAAYFFAFGDRLRSHPLGLPELLVVLPAALVFCMASGTVYLFNDIRDIDADRRHPVKRLRPIASGALPVPAAKVLLALLLALTLGCGAILSTRFLAVVGTYLFIQAVYTLWLKDLAIVDALVIASGFVLRAVAGAVVLPDVTISPWLLICTFLLALFLALCKRRHEKLLSPEDGHRHRASLADYDERLLDQLIAITAAAAIVSYSIYTLWPQTVTKFGSAGLAFTIPFVVAGIFRYLDLVYRHEQGGRPEKILLTDLPLLGVLLLYGLTVATVFLFPPLAGAIGH